MKLFIVWATQQNRDLTEGKGGMVDVSLWDNEASAVNDAKGRGVMGVGDGRVVKRTFTDHPSVTGRVEFYEEEVYGYRKNWLGKWDYGYIDLRDAPTNDPEYAEFLRLKAKFDK